jgi:hypothetical protein
VDVAVGERNAAALFAEDRRRGVTLADPRGPKV